jgi:2-oxoglutarate dehydrogenase E2 component (dihydrolipoamide succinyltransferase)
MSTPVVMPQMGESIAEGTIVRWIKKVGDPVDRDEPLFEISTDKVDAEIPSPAAGVLTEIKVHEGETVAVNSVVATIGDARDVGKPAPPEPPAAAATASGIQKAAATAAASTQPQGDGSPASARTRASGREMSRPEEITPELTQEDLRRQKSSPLVRRIARDNNVDITQIAGSGIGGRVTKDDILEYLGKPEPKAAVAARKAPSVQSPAPGASVSPAAGRVEVQPLSVMRKKIAEHMIMSRRTSAHVHSVFHVDFSRVEKIRRDKKDGYEQLGAKLTYMAFIAKVIVDTIRRHPIINASLDGDNVIYKKDVNLGVAVALESGLIVPVIKNADEKNLLGLSRAIADLAERARAKQLKPEEVHDGTFTITNPGQFGAQFGMPIINQPQVAILGVGTIEKRPVVVDDGIAIRTMAYLTLGYDHRLVDGAVADQFMADIKKGIEQFDPSQV